MIRIATSKRFWPTRSEGFTLVEVLVALTISTVGLIAALGALSLADSASARVENLRRAQLIAESQLNAAVVGPLDRMGTSEGKSGRFTWVMEIVPSHHPRLAEIVVTVTWKESARRGRYQLATLREYGEKP